MRPVWQNLSSKRLLLMCLLHGPICLPLSTTGQCLWIWGPDFSWSKGVAKPLPSEKTEKNGKNGKTIRASAAVRDGEVSVLLYTHLWAMLGFGEASESFTASYGFIRLHTASLRMPKAILTKKILAWHPLDLGCKLSLIQICLRLNRLLQADKSDKQLML